MEYAGVEVLILNATIRNQFRTEEINPLAVRSMRHLPFIAAIAAEQLSVPGHIEVDRPLVALQMIPGSRTCLDVVACYPEVFSARSLEVVPESLAIDAPELVSENFHCHRARMDFGDLAAV